MKHIFIMNPAAGKGKAGKVFLPQIIDTAKRLELDYEIHRTISPGDAQRFVSSRCAARGNSSEDVTWRFYACGGDGTFNEVVNGAYGYNNVEVAMIPSGTGNDFPRNFSNLKYFEDMERQVRGEAKPLDLMRYEEDNPEDSSAPIVRYGVNMFNIGLDCNVVDQISEMKSYPLIPSPMAYILGVGIVLGKKKGVDLEIVFEDGETHNGEIMLAAIGNGCFCGGGFKGLPNANLKDGLMDVIIIEEISRQACVSLLRKYRKGTHLEDARASQIITYRKCKSLRIHPNREAKLCTDGEISTLRETSFEIVPGGIKFSIPQGCE